MNKVRLILITIVLLGLFLRFYELGNNPPSLNLDEVAIGYNAYSILKTGRDEYGEQFPLAFRSHDDYKPPLYIYLTVPSIALFGLNGFAVRFPSALAGTLTVLITYFLVIELFKDKNSKFIIRNSRFIAIIAALLLAINPWHLQLSRAAFEANVAVFLTVLGILAFLKGMKKNINWWMLASLSFALSLYTYQASRLFIPLLSLAIVIVYLKEIKKNLKQAILASALFIVIVLPLISLMTSTAGIMRFKGTSVFEHPGLVQEEIDRSLIDAQRQDRFAMRVLHNRRIAAFFTVAEGYFKHFRPDLIFLGRHGPPINYTPNVGLLHLIELPFLLWGLHLLWSQKGKSKTLLTSWLLLAPVASSFTWDAPNSTRMAIILPVFQIISAMGIFGFCKWIKSFHIIIWRFTQITLSSIFLLSLVYYLHQYYIHAPIEYAQSWQFGYKEAVEYVNNNKHEFDRVIVSTNLKQSQNFFAFYTVYDPWTYIYIDGGTVSGGFLETENRFGKYEFHPVDYANLKAGELILVVDLYGEVPAEYQQNIIRTIYLPNGEPYIAIMET